MDKVEKNEKFSVSNRLQRLKLITIAGFVILLVGYASLLFNGPLHDKIWYNLISAGVAMIIVGIIGWKKMKNIKDVQDEMSIAIGRKALSFSWFYTYILIAVLALLVSYEIIQLTALEVLGIIFFFMLGSQLTIRLVFARKGVSYEK